MQSLVHLWSRLSPEARGVVLISVATLSWLAINYVALKLLQHVEHDLVQGLHFILHLAFLGVMVWIEMHIGDAVARWSGAEFISKVRRKAIYVAVSLILLVATACYVVCFGLCSGGACREGVTRAVMTPPYQPVEWHVVVILLLCTFLLRGYAWAMHHAEVQRARASDPRPVD